MCAALGVCAGAAGVRGQDAGALVNAAPSAAPSATTQPPVGVFRNEDARSALYGIELSAGHFRVFYAPSTGVERTPSVGSFRAEGERLITLDEDGSTGVIRVRLEGAALRVWVAGFEARMVRAQTLCATARDCRDSETAVVPTGCSNGFYWTCAAGTHECRSACDRPGAHPGQSVCAAVLCPRGQYCCNALSGACAPRGGGCGQ